ncbi:MAG: DUF3604 domain-containing protein, partial [Deltaproteobacteria bacterium]|nr:DUF3604 domain-containing protein [Deltaproteobacteria bacterium]
AVAAAPSKQILFGDLHVHTTFSPDAFVLSLPLMGGEGVHPPADACDYARFCSALDFWSINDHAEGVSPQHWRETVEAIGQCNAVAGDATNPDTVAFLGWEWSQVGSTPAEHFGHKNVVLRDFEPLRVPTRPIAALRPEFRVPLMPVAARALLPLAFFSERQRYFDYFLYAQEVEATPACPFDVDTRDLPSTSHEVARDPDELFAKLDQWGFPSLVIPHGTSWGLMTPPGSSWDIQLDQRHPRQNLIEVYSGHGSSEEYRPWSEVAQSEDGTAVCAEPRDGFEPCCRRAGEIIRSRCDDSASALCEERVRAARANYVAAGVAGHNTVPGATLEDWGECGQCTDCFLPAFNTRPQMSAQYAVARDFRFGFLAASDTHTGRGGNGFKEHGRRQLTEGRGPIGPLGRSSAGDAGEATQESLPVVVGELPLQRRRFTERGASFLVTGGLTAVHAPARDRVSIWKALEQREVYGTSGDRILLWFELLNAPDGPAPMGAEVSQMAVTPRFRVAAAGAFEQRPGCPVHVEESLSAAGSNPTRATRRAGRPRASASKTRGSFCPVHPMPTAAASRSKIRSLRRAPPQRPTTSAPSRSPARP